MEKDHREEGCPCSLRMKTALVKPSAIPAAGSTGNLRLLKFWPKTGLAALWECFWLTDPHSRCWQFCKRKRKEGSGFGGWTKGTEELS